MRNYTRRTYLNHPVRRRFVVHTRGQATPHIASLHAGYDQCCRACSPDEPTAKSGQVSPAYRLAPCWLRTTLHASLGCCDGGTVKHQVDLQVSAVGAFERSPVPVRTGLLDIQKPHARTALLAFGQLEQAAPRNEFVRMHHTLPRQ